MTPERLINDLRQALVDIKVELSDTEHRNLVDEVLEDFGLYIPPAAELEMAIVEHPAGRRLENR